MITIDTIAFTILSLALVALAGFTIHTIVRCWNRPTEYKKGDVR